MALTPTFIVTNEDGFGRRETLPWGRTKPAGLLGGLAELGEGGHLSPSKCDPFPPPVPASPDLGEVLGGGQTGGPQAVGQGPLPPVTRPL